MDYMVRRPLPGTITTNLHPAWPDHKRHCWLLFYPIHEDGRQLNPHPIYTVNKVWSSGTWEGWGNCLFNSALTVYVCIEKAKFTAECIEHTLGTQRKCFLNSFEEKLFSALSAQNSAVSAVKQSNFANTGGANSPYLRKPAHASYPSSQPPRNYLVLYGMISYCWKRWYRD